MADKPSPQEIADKVRNATQAFNFVLADASRAGLDVQLHPTWVEQTDGRRQPRIEVKIALPL